MTEETQIIPVPPPEQDAAVTALVKAKGDYSLMGAARMSDDELRETFRNWYRETVRAGILTILNVGIQTYGTPAGDGYLWNITPISISATCNTVKQGTEIRKGDKVVYSNLNGEEYCNPGNWLFEMLDTIRRLDAERAARQVAQREAVREGRIRDLLAEV